MRFEKCSGIEFSTAESPVHPGYLLFLRGHRFQPDEDVESVVRERIRPEQNNQFLSRCLSEALPIVELNLKGL